MATSKDQLREVCEDLHNKFVDNEYIQVIPSDDDPPEKYEVKYSILGLIQNSDGKVVEAREHSIFINIPFGFPHFPPSCTPQSSTFHPDFDEDAICIGDFWNKEKTLPELILHIGKMILGEIYSTENAFNNSAVSWYQKIADQIPFEDVKLSYAEEGTPQKPLELEKDEHIPHTIDTLDDNDITNSPDYFDTGQMEDFDDELSLTTPTRPSGKSSVNKVYLLARQKRYHELSLFLRNLPTKEQFEDRKEIETNIIKELNKAEKLQKEANELEHQGDPRGALELFEKVADIVADFPNIQESIERTKNSVDLAGEWGKKAKEPTNTAKKQPQKNKGKRRVSSFKEATKTTVHFLPILAIVIVAVLAVVLIQPLFSAKSNLEKATQMYGQCRQFLEMGQFTRAQRQCQDARVVLEKIHLYKTSERDALLKEIKLTMNSEEMEQGLAGLVFFQGKFVQKTHINRITEFDERVQQAEGYFNESSWEEAADHYSQALQIATPILNSFDKRRMQEVQDKISISKIHLAINNGSSLLSRGELNKSRETFANALTAAQALPEEHGSSLISLINPKLQEVQYLQHLDSGKKYFSASEWEKAIEEYEKALQLRDDSAAVASQYADAESLSANMAEAELYASINKAKDAFSNANMDMAIERYQNAISLLSTKKELLQRINPDEIKQQLERVILQTKVGQFKQEAEQKLTKSRFQDAITTLEQMIATITASELQEDNEFKAIIKDAQKTISATRSKATIAKRVQYLEENYKKLFIAHYSAAVPESLSEPKATFLKFENNKELYELQCLERKQGRKLRLVMLYSYDPSRNKWQFYNPSQ